MISLGIDTSNYTSSIAVAENGEILVDNRTLLSLKHGALGLRQSDALFQHWENLPKLLETALKYKLDNIVVSIKPRPQDNSYMPCFNAGLNIAQILGNALNIPVIQTSHQQGHILAACYKNDIDFSLPTVFAHLSGGTLELVDKDFNILAKTKDISYGQLIDRTGQFLGIDFPAGKTIDSLALQSKPIDNPLSKIHIDNTDLNISGIENQVKALKLKPEEIAYCVMERITESFISVINKIGIEQVVVTGGVASSQFIRKRCNDKKYIFGQPNLCSDNAVGLALSGGNFPWE